MATIKRDNIYLLETQAKHIKEFEQTDVFFNKQDFYRRAIETAINNKLIEQKKVNNYNSMQNGRSSD